ncbi:hypothetical protein BCR39DRAFT_585037 [Naematelia encephala]|uniref:SnoaL-like domain-containing protein n=1 Tax=Naematelia encephala TaxID=71784 RepID=A0A1Y2BLA6_9TREE|nr:hypothetical protein BCR39DRAFT_585037 [Naematelia encephala]
MADSKVTSTELHSSANDPSTLNFAPGLSPTDLQRRHAAIVLDMFQAKGTMAKLRDNFSEDAVYEDLFASCKTREEVGGQLLHLPTICTSATTNSHLITSLNPITTTSGSGRSVPTTEIAIKVDHTFVFKAPLPVSARSITMNTTLLVYSDEQEGKIVRLQDRPMEQIPENALLSWIRRGNAVGVPKVIPLPKDEKEDAEKVLKQQR